MRTASWSKKVLYFLFFLSGICGLVYEVLWARYLGLFIGNTTYAHTIVLASFMLGLALGNLFFGKMADRDVNHLTCYAWLEISLGLFAIITPNIFLWQMPVFSALGKTASIGSPILQVLKLALSFPVILLPAFLMGGTLPLIAKIFIHGLGNVKNEVAKLYAFNSFGAVAGALSSAFFLIPKFGLDFSVSIAAVTNIAIGVGAIALRSTLRPPAQAAVLSHGQEIIPSESVANHQMRIALITIGISGLTAMFYEIAWFRLFALVLGSSTYSFALMLAAFISGIALGSACLTNANWRFNRLPAYTLLALAETGIGLSVAVSMPLYERLPYYFGQINGMIVHVPATFPVYEGIKYFFCFIVMLVPTLFFGMTLPLVVRLFSRNPVYCGQSVGKVFAVNTLGAVLGSLLAGFFVIPAFGLKGTFLIANTINAALGGLLLFTGNVFDGKRFKSLLCLLPVIATAGIGCLTPPWNQIVFTRGTFRGQKIYTDFEAFKAAASWKILYYRDGAQSTVTVSQDSRGMLSLFVNGKADASTDNDLKTEILLGHIPLLLHREPRQVLNIGIGSGITCGAILAYPVENLDVVEISGEVVEASKLFKDHNRAFYLDPRVRIFNEDAKTFLILTPSLYDVIVSEPSNPWMSGVASLFSKEYFMGVKSHLKEKGIFAQWFHTYEMSDETVEMVIRTLASVFPHVSVWHPSSGDIMMIASLEPIQMDWDSTKERLAIPEVKQDLQRVKIRDLPGFLSHEMLSSKRVRKILSPGLINSDYFPYLEYQAPKDFFYRDHSAKLYEKDERLLRPERGTLFLSTYMADHPLTAPQLDNLYDATDVMPLLQSLAERWLAVDPESPLAEKARSHFNMEGMKATALFYENLSKKHPGNIEYLKKYILSYYDYYRRTGTILFSANMTEWLKFCDDAIRLSPKHKELFFLLKAQVFYRERDISASILTLREGLTYLEEAEKAADLAPGSKKDIYNAKIKLLMLIIDHCLEEDRYAEAVKTLEDMLIKNQQEPAIKLMLEQVRAKIDGAKNL